jgi:hypothetical protein
LIIWHYFLKPHILCFQVIAERLTEEEIAGLREIFKAVNVKNRGVISFGELKEGLRRYGTGLEDSEISDIMEVVSTCLAYTLFLDSSSTCMVVRCLAVLLFNSWLTVTIYCFQYLWDSERLFWEMPQQYALNKTSCCMTCTVVR